MTPPGQPFATGAAVNVAMRLQQAALPNGTLIGEATERLACAQQRSSPWSPSTWERLGPAPGVPPAGGRRAHGAGVERACSSGEKLHWRRSQAFRRVRGRRARIVVVLGEAGIARHASRRSSSARSATRRAPWSAAACRTERARPTCRWPRSCANSRPSDRRQRLRDCSKATSMRRASASAWPSSWARATVRRRRTSSSGPSGGSSPCLRAAARISSFSRTCIGPSRLLDLVEYSQRGRSSRRCSSSASRAPSCARSGLR